MLEKAPKSASNESEGQNLRERLNLEYVQTALVKFSVVSRGEVLGGIPSRRRPDQDELDDKHVQEAKAERIARWRLMRDAIRPDNIDTGVEVIHQAEDVGVPTLPVALTQKEYGLRDVHFFTQKKGTLTLFVIVFAFEYGKASAENTDALLRMYGHYARDSWTVSVWDNPNLTATVNCTNRKADEKPSRKLVAGKKYMHLV